MSRHVFLTGGTSEDRSALLIRALSDLRVISGGYALLSLAEEDGSRSPVLLLPQEAAAAVFPRRFFPDAGIASSEALCDALASALPSIQEKELGYLDPLPPVSLLSAELQSDLSALFASDVALVGTVEAEDSLAFLRAQDSVLLLSLDENTEEDLISLLRAWADDTLDRAHHKKFDPLMKLRARRRRPDPLSGESK